MRSRVEREKDILEEREEESEGEKSGERERRIK